MPFLWLPPLKAICFLFGTRCGVSLCGYWFFYSGQLYTRPTIHRITLSFYLMQILGSEPIHFPQRTHAPQIRVNFTDTSTDRWPLLRGYYSCGQSFFTQMANYFLRESHLVAFNFCLTPDSSSSGNRLLWKRRRRRGCVEIRPNLFNFDCLFWHVKFWRARWPEESRWICGCVFCNKVPSTASPTKMRSERWRRGKEIKLVSVAFPPPPSHNALGRQTVRQTFLFLEEILFGFDGDLRIYVPRGEWIVSGITFDQTP